MTSNSQGTYDDMKHITPYLLLKIVSVNNLNQVWDSYNLTPYISIVLGNSEWKSLVGTSNSDDYEWNEVFQIDINDPSPLTLTIHDKDEHGSDDTIQRFVFNQTLFHNWKEPTTIHLKLEKSVDEDLESQIVEDESFVNKNEYESFLSLEVTYMDSETLGKLTSKIVNHRTIVKNKQAFTLYEVWISRNDGLRWKVDLRFSDFVEIRNELRKILFGVDMLPFPHKTYFDWLGNICTCASKFNENRIIERKQMLESFLNTILDNFLEFSCDSVTNLLKLSNPL